MSKVLRSIYIDVLLYQRLEQNNVNINAICTEALEKVVSGGEAGKELLKDAELRKDEQDLIKALAKPRTKASLVTLDKLVRDFGIKYHMSFEMVLRKYNR